MECGKAAREEDKGGQMVAFELEAAEALAGLARCSSLRGGELKRTEAAAVASGASQLQDQLADAEQVCDHAPTMTASPEKTQKIVENIPSHLCSTSSQSNPVIKSRQKLTEAEKEERKIRRILANRESARQTIRRRRAMYLELTRKAADVLEENETLKKEKELVAEKYNSLEGRNKFLKAQLAEVKKAEAGETEDEPMTSEAEKSCSATTSTPIFLHNNQPSIVPCFWPSILPSSDVYPFQCAAHSHNMSPSQFPTAQRDINVPCSHQPQENPTGNATQGTPLFVIPVPWLVPLLPHSNTLHSHSSSNDQTNTRQCSKCSCSETRLHEDNNLLSSNQNMQAEASNPVKTVSLDSVHVAKLTHQPCGTVVVPGLFSPVRPLEMLGPPRSCHVDDTSDANAASAPESVRHGGLQRKHEPIICPPKKPVDVFAGTEARRRRKELMKLKNVHCHDVRTR